MTNEQYERTEEALVTAIERAETPEATIRLTELLMEFRRHTPSAELAGVIRKGAGRND